jgi:hypothetical protein
VNKLLTLIFGIIIAVPALSQQTELVEILKRWPNRADVQVVDGLIHKRLVSEQSDTAFYFHPNGKQFIATTTFKEIGVVPPEPVLKETLNDNSTRVIYTGTWIKYTNQSWTVPFLNNDVSVSTTVNSAATVTFSGRKVSVTAELRENHGVAKIEVKQGTTVIDSKIVDMYKASAVNAPAVIYTSAVLPQGTYTVTVSLNSISTGRDSIVLDSFSVFE